MKLKEQPQTEQQYWMAIEGLGSFSFGMDHDLAHDKIPEESQNSVSNAVISAYQLQEELVREVCERFGVVHPKDYLTEENFGKELPPAPEGRVYYWDWYKLQKRIFYTAEYNKLICSACPLSEGVDSFLSTQRIPCSVFRGSISRLEEPYACAMTDLFGHPQWSRGQLYQAILEKDGVRGLDIFLQREVQLKNLANNPT